MHISFPLYCPYVLDKTSTRGGVHVEPTVKIRNGSKEDRLMCHPQPSGIFKSGEEQYGKFMFQIDFG